MKKTYFNKEAYKNSTLIGQTVLINLKNCLIERNQDKRVFIDWVKEQELNEFSERSINRMFKGEFVSEHLSVLCLAAIYMNKHPEDVFFMVLPRNSFKA